MATSRRHDPLHVVVGLGPVGRAVIDELVTRGHRVRAVARHGAPDLPPGVEFTPADVTDVDDGRRALAGAGIVYHAASAPYHRWPQLLPPLMSGVIAGAGALGHGSCMPTTCMPTARSTAR